MISLAGLKPEEDIEILFTGLRPGEKLYEEVLSEVEATLPTYNEKIKIAKVKSVNYFSIKDSLNNLVAAAKKWFRLGMCNSNERNCAGIYQQKFKV